MHDADREPISLTLSPTQVEEVLRAASQSKSSSVTGLIAEALRSGQSAITGKPEYARSAPGHHPGARGYPPDDTSDRRLSRSLLRGLSILTAFGASNQERGIVELSREVGMSASTAHRYALTLVELGLLERCPRSRKYRLPEALTA